MLNFTYVNPTKIIFGKDQLHKLKDELIPYKDKSILLVYGKSSIKDLGIYQHIVEIFDELNIKSFEVSHIRANPSLESVLIGRELIVKHQIDFILAAGGGSVIDAAKAMAFSPFFQSHEVWQVYLRKLSIKKALPLGVILTLSGTGTESNGNTVITNDETGKKIGIGYDILRPTFAIIDPSHSNSVPKDIFIASGIDVMMHVFEQYFSPTPNTSTSDYMCMAILKTTMQSLIEIVHHNDHYDARANLAWAATIGLNWILQQGKVGDWSTHQLSYPITSKYGITHGYALSMILPSWLTIAYEHNESVMSQKLTFLGQEVFNVDDPIKVIESIRLLLSSLEAPTSLLEAGISPSIHDIDDMAHVVTELGTVGQVVIINKEIAKAIYLKAMSLPI